MAAFSDNEQTWDRVDWRLLQVGAVSLYHRDGLLEEHTAWLRDHGYRVVSLDATHWENRSAALREIGRALDFPRHYTRRPGALNKCLADLELPDPGGLALVIRGFDAFHRVDSLAAWHLLDTVEYRSRQFLLTGKRLIALVHTADENLRLPPIGGRHIPRNWIERAERRRGTR